jgi:hypothetical protein
LLSVENFVGQISEESVRAAPQGEQQVLIRATGESLVGQTGKLTLFIRRKAGRLSAAQRSQLDEFLEVQDGETFANRGVEISKQLLSRGIIGNLVHWISQHLKELKKILTEILHFIFDLLHIPYPAWIDKIALIIDEFSDLLLSLLSDVFGIDFRLAARQLSEQEVNFLREWAAFETLRAVRASRNPFAQDER